jgi:hypothetical protein
VFRLTLGFVRVAGFIALAFGILALFGSTINQKHEVPRPILQ